MKTTATAGRNSLVKVAKLLIGYFLQPKHPAGAAYYNCWRCFVSNNHQQQFIFQPSAHQ